MIESLILPAYSASPTPSPSLPFRPVSTSTSFSEHSSSHGTSDRSSHRSSTLSSLSTPPLSVVPTLEFPPTSQPSSHYYTPSCPRSTSGCIVCVCARSWDALMDFGLRRGTYALSEPGAGLDEEGIREGSGQTGIARWEYTPTKGGSDERYGEECGGGVGGDGSGEEQSRD
jgi:hypothetical protein